MLPDDPILLEQLEKHSRLVETERELQSQLRDLRYEIREMNSSIVQSLVNSGAVHEFLRVDWTAIRRAQSRDERRRPKMKGRKLS